MKRTLIVLSIILLTRITCFSSTILTPIETDSLVQIKSSDLKIANLIFVEHSKLLKENSLLQKQVKNYIDLNKESLKLDSLRLQQIEEYKILNKEYISQINDLNKEVKKKNKRIRFWQIGGITVSIGFVLFLILK